MAKIVVVEDQKVLATVYRNKFIAEGHQVEIASDGEEGLALINSARPDLVILDLTFQNLTASKCSRKFAPTPCFKPCR